MLPDLVENLLSLQYQSVRRGRPRYLWRWKFILRPSHQKRSLAVADWKVLSESQRQLIRLAAFCLMNEGVAGMKQSTFTDGNLTVLHRTDAGKKLGSHRQPRADRKSLKTKKENCYCVKRDTKLTVSIKITECCYST